MKVTEEQLTEIEKWASAYYKPEDVALIMQFDEEEFKTEYKNKSSDVFKAFHRARLKQKGEVIISVFNQAKAGSGPAQSQALKIIRDFELEEEL